MGLETGTRIEDLNTTNPAAGDNVSEGDDHLRLIKTCVQGSFPSLGATAVTKTAAEINDLVEQTNPTLNGDVAGTAFLDEDDMASDSDTKLASQQSIKTYVDNKTVINKKIIDIGDWDMDATQTVAVAHGLTLSKIRSVSVLIRRDDDALYIDFAAPSVVAQSNFISMGSTNVTLSRATSGAFDGTNFNATSFNRGWITVEYTD